MKRFAMKMALLAAAATLPGCVFAVGSKLETDHGDRLNRLDRRISAAEKELGLNPPPRPAAEEKVEE